MYIPKYHALTDVAAMQAHIGQHALGAWVCGVGDQLVANHIPFILDRQHGSHGRLLGHVSRANAVWRTCGRTSARRRRLWRTWCSGPWRRKGRVGNEVCGECRRIRRIICGD